MMFANTQEHKVHDWPGRNSAIGSLTSSDQRGVDHAPSVHHVRVVRDAR